MVSDTESLRRELASSMAGAATALDAADLLCHACVRLLDVDGAAISLIHQESNYGTYGSSSELIRSIDELQFTFGEGPCLDAASSGRAVFAPDLADPGELRWPIFTPAALALPAAALFALPISLTSATIGALDLFRQHTGELSAEDLVGAGLVASLAVLPLLELMAANLDPTAAPDDTVDTVGTHGPDQLASLERVEVYQATGMLMAAWSVTSAEALVRLRAHAFALDRSTHVLAAAVVARTVLIDEDGFKEGDVL